MSRFSETTVETWWQEHQLTDVTRQVLEEDGFSSLELLALLNPSEVDDTYRTRLPLAQTLALKRALGNLKLEETQTQTQTQTQNQTQNPNPNPNQGNMRPDPTASVTSKAVPCDGGALNDRGDAETLQLQLFPVREPFGGPEGMTGKSSEMTMSGGTRPARGSADVQPTKSIYDEEVSYRFLLVGKTGCGKSTTGNSILGGELFDGDVAFDSQTFRNQLERGAVNGKVVEIMDCPGLFDTSRTHEDISADIVKAVACMHPGPHAVLYVIRLGRYTEEEFQVYKRLKALFDQRVVDHIIVVFTGGDGLEKENKDINHVLRRVPDSLRKVLEECRHRVVVFNNVAKNKQPYVQRLMREVDSLMAANRGRFYTCPRYASVGKGMEEEVARRLIQLEEEELANNPYTRELKAKARAIEDSIKERRQSFQRRDRERRQQMQMLQEAARREMEEMARRIDSLDCTAGEREAEKRAMLERHQRALEEKEREMEAQRQEDAKELEKKQDGLQLHLQMLQRDLEKSAEERLRTLNRKMAELKRAVARGREPSLLDSLLMGARYLIGKILPI